MRTQIKDEFRTAMKIIFLFLKKILFCQICPESTLRNKIKYLTKAAIQPSFTIFGKKLRSMKSSSWQIKKERNNRFNQEKIVYEIGLPVFPNPNYQHSMQLQGCRGNWLIARNIAKMRWIYQTIHYWSNIQLW